MTRPELMSRIRSTGNGSTEGRFVQICKRAGLEGWVVRPSGVYGKPDIAFPGKKIAVFLDGCFWHGCPEHFRLPKTHPFFWGRKIVRNKQRRVEVQRHLYKAGWAVRRVWEHELVPDQWDTPLEKVLDVAGVERLWCRGCGRPTFHTSVDLTGKGVYVEEKCEKCLTTARRVNNEYLKGGLYGDNV